MTPEDIYQKLSVLCPDQIISIYQVGVIDNSPLSDIDLILIAKNPKKLKEILDKKSFGFDIRGVFTKEQFYNEAQYLPYIRLIHLWGEKIASIPAPEEAPLIKIAGMFFYAFLRNFYRDLEKSAPIKEVLIHLNDFEYALAWLPEIESRLISFVTKIRKARREPDNCSRETSQAYLREAIEQSWFLVELINAQLLNKLIENTSSNKFLMREPTRFIDGGSEESRSATEKNIFRVVKFKEIYLPTSFQRLLSSRESSFAGEYARRYLAGPRFGQRGWLKHRIKMIL